MEMTPEQEIQRARLKVELADHYQKLFKSFFTSCTLDLPEEIIVLTGAYKIDRNKIALEQAKKVIEQRLEALGRGGEDGYSKNLS